MWRAKLETYCRDFNIPIEYIKEILNDPKVVPMVRGKAFEFSVLQRLKSLLPEQDWLVDKPMMNAQFGLHDMDVRVIHRRTRKIIGVECKLAKKGSFRLLTRGGAKVSVKCMRSRTLGEEKVRELAPILGVPVEVLTVHNDQYRKENFDVVITSLANAFYETDRNTMFYEWRPSTTGSEFLQRFNPPRDIDIKTFAFNLMYIAKADELSITRANGVVCTRRRCSNKEECEFIPNYPIINFDNTLIVPRPDHRWTPIEQAERLFTSMLNNPRLKTYAGALKLHG